MLFLAHLMDLSTNKNMQTMSGRQKKIPQDAYLGLDAYYISDQCPARTFIPTTPVNRQARVCTY